MGTIITDISKLKSLYSSFKSEKDSFCNGSFSGFNSSYLNSCGDNYVRRMASKLKTKYDRIQKTYNNIDKWWDSYNKNATGLEQSLSNCSVTSIDVATVTSVVASLYKLKSSTIEEATYNIPESYLAQFNTINLFDEDLSSNLAPNKTRLSNSLKKDLLKDIVIGGSVGKFNVASGYDSAFLATNDKDRETLIKKLVNSNSIFKRFVVVNSDGTYTQITDSGANLSDLAKKYGAENIAVDVANSEGESQAWVRVSDLISGVSSFDYVNPRKNLVSPNYSSKEVKIAKMFDNLYASQKSNYDTLIIENGIDYSSAAEKCKSALVKTGATIGAGVSSLVEGIASFGESLVDAAAIINTGKKTVERVEAAGLAYLLTSALTGKEISTDNVVNFARATYADIKKDWDDTKAFVSKEHVKSAWDGFYENTALGSAIKNNSFGFETVRDVGSGVGYIAGIVGLSALTMGIGGALAGSAAVSAGASTAASGITVGIGGLTGTITADTVASAAIAGVAGLGKNTSKAWNDGASTTEGLAYGGVMSIWEGFEMGLGKFINSTTLSVAEKVSSPFVSQLINTGTHVALDTADAATGAFTDPFFSIIYSPTKENEKELLAIINKDGGNRTWDDLSLTDKYKAMFEYRGGWSNVGTQAAIGGAFSFISEIGDLWKAAKGNNVKNVFSQLPSGEGNPKISVLQLDNIKEVTADDLAKLRNHEIEIIMFADGTKLDYEDLVNNFGKNLDSINNKEISNMLSSDDKKLLKSAQDVSDIIDSNSSDAVSNVKSEIAMANFHTATSDKNRFSSIRIKDLDDISLDDLKLINNPEKIFFLMPSDSASIRLSYDDILNQKINFESEALVKQAQNITGNYSAKSIGEVADEITGQLDINLQSSLNNKINLKDSVLGFLLNPFETITKFIYTPVDNNKELKDTILEKGLYHVTSESAADRIIESGFLKASGHVSSYGSKKCFFFAGEPDFDGVSRNLNGFKTKLTAVKFDVDEELASSLKHREFSDLAVTYGGNYVFKDGTATKVYLGLVEENGKLFYKEMNFDEWSNYTPKINTGLIADSINSTKMALNGLAGEYHSFKNNLSKLAEFGKKLKSMFGETKAYVDDSKSIFSVKGDNLTGAIEEPSMSAPSFMGNNYTSRIASSNISQDITRANYWTAKGISSTIDVNDINDVSLESLRMLDDPRNVIIRFSNNQSINARDLLMQKLDSVSSNAANSFVSSIENQIDYINSRTSKGNFCVLKINDLGEVSMDSLRKIQNPKNVSFLLPSGKRLSYAEIMGQKSNLLSTGGFSSSKNVSTASSSNNKNKNNIMDNLFSKIQKKVLQFSTSSDSQKDIYKFYDESVKKYIDIAKKTNNKNIEDLLENLYKIKRYKSEFSFVYSDDISKAMPNIGRIFMDKNSINTYSEKELFHEVGHVLHDLVDNSTVPSNYESVIQKTRQYISNNIDYFSYISKHFENYNSECINYAINFFDSNPTFKQSILNRIQKMSIDDIEKYLKNVGLNDVDMKNCISNLSTDYLYEIERSKGINMIAGNLYKSSGYLYVSDILNAVFNGKKIAYYDNGVKKYIPMYGHPLKYYQASSTLLDGVNRASFHEQIANYISLRITGDDSGLKILKDTLGPDWVNMMENNFQNIINYLKNS